MKKSLRTNFITFKKFVKKTNWRYRKADKLRHQIAKLSDDALALVGTEAYWENRKASWALYDELLALGVK